MHPRIAELIHALDEHHEDLRRAVESVSAAQRGQAPARDRWSVAGVIEHLSLLEARITPLFRSRVADARTARLGAETETSSVLATFDLNLMLDRSQRLVAPEIMVPKPDTDPEAAWQALDVTWQDFRQAVIEADGLALGT